MKLTKSQLQFIINSNVEELVAMLQEDYGMSVIEAFDRVYNSELYSKLVDTGTGLYLQSSAYLYDYLKEEFDTRCIRKSNEI